MKCVKQRIKTFLMQLGFMLMIYLQRENIQRLLFISVKLQGTLNKSF